MGGSASGARLARGALGSAADAADVRLRRLHAARLGGPADARLRLQLLGQHRGDALRLRRRRLARGAAPGGDDRRRVGRASACGRHAGHPGSRRVPAAGGDRLRAGQCPRGGVPGGSGAVGAVRDRGRRRAGRRAGARVGAGRARGQRGQDDRPRPARHRADHRRRRAGRSRPRTAGSASSTRTPSSRRSRRPCPRPTTTRSSGGTRRVGSAGSPTSRSRTPGRTRATRCGRS